jgi:hypothetical protein
MKDGIQFLIRIEVTTICLHESNILNVIVFSNFSCYIYKI